MGKRSIAGGSEIHKRKIKPDYQRSVMLRYLPCVIVGTSIDNDAFIYKTAHGIEAGLKIQLLVPHNHAEAEHWIRLK